MSRPVVYSTQLPTRSQFPSDCVLFYDSVLLTHKPFKAWVKQFEHSIGLKSGESLKTVDSFNDVLKKITKMKVPQSAQLTFISVGGGSIGDFIGFMASVYLRGRKLVHIPSTWLSAIDSAHGGKNGLNFEGVKNQVGTFYLADKIYICKELLETQPGERLCEAMGEVLKTAVLFDKKLFSEIEAEDSGFNHAQIWKRLERLITHKYDLVEKDPQEKSGLRRLLNLGHTMGHVLEAHYEWPHGVCVLLGLEFAAVWSCERKLLSIKDCNRINALCRKIQNKISLQMALKKLPEKKLIGLLKKDKKLISQTEVDFIFIKAIGNCVRKQVSVDEIVAEVRRQKAVS
jgi:3-dehydroquinate synthetase